MQNKKVKINFFRNKSKLSRNLIKLFGYTKVLANRIKYFFIRNDKFYLKY